MAKITRKTQKVFAQNATNNGVFGSAQLGTKVLSNDPAVIQGLAAWANGWNDATISGQKLPTLEEMQGIQFVQTRQIAYLLQEGIPEWDAGTEYHQNSVVKKTGTYELYGSAINTNTGNALPAAVSNSNWTYLGVLGQTNVSQITAIDATVAANALTISASALSLDFRSATLTSGTVTRVSGTPANIVVPNTATLGTANATLAQLVVVAINNAGTIELAVANISGLADLSETGVISTTALSTGSDSSGVFYSTNARTNVAYRVIGFIESTQTTAGTWAAAPSKIQGAGGQALISPLFASSIGGNGWQRLPSGLILQWGSVAITATTTAVTWPIAFPTAARNVVVSHGTAGVGQSLSGSALTTTGFNIDRGGATNETVYWSAIGN